MLNKADTKRHGWFWRLMAVFLAVLLGIIALSAVGSVFFGADRAMAAVAILTNKARVWLHALQLAMICLVWWKWDAIVSWMVKRGAIAKAAEVHFLAARNRVIAMLFAIQLIVVMGLPFRIPFHS